MAEIGAFGRCHFDGEEAWTNKHPAKLVQLTLSEAQRLANAISTKFNLPKTTVIYSDRRTKNRHATIWTNGNKRYGRGNATMCVYKDFTALTIIHEMAHHGAHGHGPHFKANMRLFVTVWEEFEKTLYLKKPMEDAQVENNIDIVLPDLQIAEGYMTEIDWVPLKRRQIEVADPVEKEPFNPWDVVEVLVENADERHSKAITYYEIGKELKDIDHNNAQNVATVKEQLVKLGYDVRVR
jgi:hypothetical protein